MAVAGSCPIGAQIVRNFGLLRAAQSDDVCVVNWLVRSLPADWPARCPASTPVPNREPVPLGRRAEHAWIADSVQALHRRTAGSDVQPGSRPAASPSADLGRLVLLRAGRAWARTILVGARQSVHIGQKTLP